MQCSLLGGMPLQKATEQRKNKQNTRIIMRQNIMIEGIFGEHDNECDWSLRHYTTSHSATVAVAHYIYMYAIYAVIAYGNNHYSQILMLFWLAQRLILIWIKYREQQNNKLRTRHQIGDECSRTVIGHRAWYEMFWCFSFEYIHHCHTGRVKKTEIKLQTKIWCASHFRCRNALKGSQSVPKCDSNFINHLHHHHLIKAVRMNKNFCTRTKADN